MSKQSDKPASVVAGQFDAPAGGGGFAFNGLSIGIFLVDQPTHRIAVGRDARSVVPLSANQGWILPAGVEGMCEFDVDHRFISVEIDEGLLRDVGLEDARALAPQFGALDPLLMQLSMAAATPSPGAPTLYLETMRHALAAHVAQLVQPPPELAAAIDDARLRRAIAYIHDNLASDLSLDALAAEAAMSAFHFSRAFKKATGKPPLQFVIAERLARAKVLLQTTQLPVAEVAHRVGYEDVSRFGQHFKRHFGATPGSVRR